MTVERGHQGSGAIFSDETWPIYRYALWRQWREGGRGRALFIMLNPSTADESDDDPTIRRCRSYAKAWGYDGVGIVNLFALRSPDPRALRRASDPVGPENDSAIHHWAETAPIVVCAWGLHGAVRGRTIARELVLMGRALHVLQLTNEGVPNHPLYLRKDLAPSPWTP